MTKPTIVGLIVDGASWKDNKLVSNSFDSKPSSMTSEFAITFNSKMPNSDKPLIELPLYSNSVRSNAICQLFVRSEMSVEAATLAGVALVIPEFPLN